MPERTIFGGWEPTGKSGEYRARPVSVPVAPQFTNFAEQSRARWDVGKWLKVKLSQLSKKTPTK